MNYAVVFTYSFDYDVTVYLFKNEEEAKEFLYNNYIEELRIDTEENKFDVDSYVSDDGWYAKIVSHFSDRDDITEYRIGNIYQ